MGRISVVIAVSILLSPSAHAQGTDACAIVDEFGLRRWSDQFKAEVGKCEAAKTAVVRSRDVSKGVSGRPPPAKPAASPVSAYSANGDARPRAIYVRDDRIEAEALGKIIHPRLQALRKAVRATGALVDSDRLEASG